MMTAFRHLRDCDAALHRRSGGSWRARLASIQLVTLPVGMAEIGSTAISNALTRFTGRTCPPLTAHAIPPKTAERPATTSASLDLGEHLPNQIVTFFWCRRAPPFSREGRHQRT